MTLKNVYTFLLFSVFFVPLIPHPAGIIRLLDNLTIACLSLYLDGSAYSLPGEGLPGQHILGKWDPGLEIPHLQAQVSYFSWVRRAQRSRCWW